MLCWWIIVFSTHPTPMSSAIRTNYMSASFCFLSYCFTLRTPFSFNLFSKLFNSFLHLFTSFIRMPGFNTIRTKFKSTWTNSFLFSSNTSLKLDSIGTSWSGAKLWIRINCYITHFHKFLVLLIIGQTHIFSNLIINLFFAWGALNRNFSFILQTNLQILFPAFSAKCVFRVTC